MTFWGSGGKTGKGNYSVNRLDPSNPLPLFSQRNGWHCHSRKAFRMEKWVNGQCQPNLENSLRTLK